MGSNPRRCGQKMAKTLEAACSGMKLPSLSAIQEAEEAPLENMKVKVKKKKMKLEDAGEESNCEHAKAALKKACKKEKNTDKQGEKEKEPKLDKASKPDEKGREEKRRDKKDKKDKKDKDAPTPMAKVGKAKTAGDVKVPNKEERELADGAPAEERGWYGIYSRWR